MSGACGGNKERVVDKYFYRKLKKSYPHQHTAKIGAFFTIGEFS